MRVLVLHCVRYEAILYHLAIDHQNNDVVYIGLPDKLAEIPGNLRCEKVSITGEKALYEEVEPWLTDHPQKFDKLISVSEFELLTAAKLRERFGINGANYAQTEKVRNKVIMKQCVQNAGIRTPRFAHLTHWLKDKTVFPVAGKVVIKPLDGASSKYVTIFATAESALDALTQCTTGVPQLDAGQYDNFEIEEYCYGPILHIDGIVSNDKILIIVASRYINSLLDFANGTPSGSVQFETDKVFENWVSTILAATEIHNGAFHLEAIETDNGNVFLEIAHRVGGARISDTFELKTGIHPSVAEIKAHLNNDIQLNIKWDMDYLYGWFIFPGHHLAADKYQISGHEYLYDHPNVLHLNQLPLEQYLLKTVTYNEKRLPLAGIIRGQTTQELTNMLNEMYSRVKITSA